MHTTAFLSRFFFNCIFEVKIIFISLSIMMLIKLRFIKFDHNPKTTSSILL